MKQPLETYACLGLVHHLLYPDCARDEAFHARTLAALAQRADIETLDCCLPMAAPWQAEAVQAVRACGKRDITFATHFFPLRSLGLAATTASETGIVRVLLREMVRQAASIGATGFVFASGRPSPAEAEPRHYEAFRDLCRWLGAELAPHGITALLEPFDTTIDKRFLYGSVQQCVDLIRNLRPESPNLGIELDVAHLPLMGEPFEDAIQTAAPVLQRVHLGNCVLKDPTHPRYGDTHPPIGLPGGEIDVPELTRILRALLDVGYLQPDQRGNLVLEMTPWPGKTPEETVRDTFRRLHQAWENA
ncbi:MAG: sugar phosphate isomerase/epimerase [Lentisphaeria bacterium]|nr:sugar phosphate isomerase/epimerase [Lentisphaeria bacterium]